MGRVLGKSLNIPLPTNALILATGERPYPARGYDPEGGGLPLRCQIGAPG